MSSPLDKSFFSFFNFSITTLFDLKMWTPSNNGTLLVYLPSPSTVSIALIPLFMQRLKSSGP